MNTMLNDEAFLSLLSSQRQLLNQLNMQMAAARREAEQQEQMKALSSGRYSVEPTFDTNHAPAINHRHLKHSNSFDTILSTLNTEKLSTLGLGNVNGQMLLSAFALGDGFGTTPLLDVSGHGSVVPLNKKRTMTEDFTGVPLWKRQRFSNKPSDFLADPSEDDLFYHSTQDYHHKVLDEELRNILEPVPLAERVQVSDSEEGDEDFDDGMDSFSQSIFEPIVFEEKKPRIIPTEIRMAMIDFASAMEKSQKSQQDIHDWDRKMGLKRSHSKTMRQSSRSRKQLRVAFKK